MAMLLMLSAPPPTLVSVTTEALLVVPTDWFGKAMLLLLKLTTGDVALPSGVAISAWMPDGLSATL